MKIIYWSLTAILLSFSMIEGTAAENLGHGFFHHGVVVPISYSRGIVAAADDSGRNVVLVWLFDNRGGYALLMIDAETGKSEQYPVPFKPEGNGPFASILSSQNKYYAHFHNNFVEFDISKRAFTFIHQTPLQETAMSMTEDDNGVIWSITYPNSGVVSFNPNASEFKSYDNVYKQNWRQYPRYVAADDKGWIYFGLGNTASQIIAFNPLTGTGVPMLSEIDSRLGIGYVYRDIDGKVYGKSLKTGQEGWYEFYLGNSRKIGKYRIPSKKKIITGSQNLFHTVFPDGKKILVCDLAKRKLIIEELGISSEISEKQKPKREISFDYTSDGAHIMSLVTSSNYSIIGSTAFPMQKFSYNPNTDQWINHKSYKQWNALYSWNGHIFIGGYPGGVLLDWDQSQPWVFTEKDKADCNPKILGEGYPDIDRPHKVIVTKGGKTIVMAGTPAYGLTGGGLLFYDREMQSTQLLKDSVILKDHSTMSLLSLSSRYLLGGTTTSAGTGGIKRAKEAELYLIDLPEKKKLWHKSILPGVQQYNDLYAAPNGLIYGIADRRIFFVFDLNQKQIIYKENIAAKYGPSALQQGPQIFIESRDKKVFVLFVKGIATIDKHTHILSWLATSPIPITAGGDYLNGKIYFASGSHLYSYEVE